MKFKGILVCIIGLLPHYNYCFQIVIMLLKKSWSSLFERGFELLGINYTREVPNSKTKKVFKKSTCRGKFDILSYDMSEIQSIKNERNG